MGARNASGGLLSCVIDIKGENGRGFKSFFQLCDAKTRKKREERETSKITVKNHIPSRTPRTGGEEGQTGWGRDRDKKEGDPFVLASPGNKKRKKGYLRLKKEEKAH